MKAEFKNSTERLKALSVGNLLVRQNDRDAKYLRKIKKIKG